MKANKYIFLVPGMTSPVRRLFGLRDYLRQQQNDYAVHAISLLCSMLAFDTLVDRAYKQIIELIDQKSVESIVLFGHSHGGRVVAPLALRLKKEFPHVRFIVITAGATMVERPTYFRWYRHSFYWVLSKAYRLWPDIPQLTASDVNQYIGYYSDSDRIVRPYIAIKGHEGELRKVEGFTHGDFIVPEKMGPVLIEVLKQ